MKNAETRLQSLAEKARDELEHDILPFWHALEDRQRGGHHAGVSHDGAVDETAPRSTVFTARLLWTLSEAWRVLACETSRSQAEHTKRFLLDRLSDPRGGGFFWSVTPDGERLETEKHVYAHAFAIYGLTAYARATGDGEAREAALATFDLVEAMANTGHGYIEAFDHRWNPIPNARLQVGGIVAPCTMNTHIHLVEAYTPLLAIARDESPKQALRDLHRLILDRFLEPDRRFAHSALDEQLTPLGGMISMGHDIETAWLLDASADALGETGLSAETRSAAAALVGAAVEFGYRGEAGFLTERRPDGPVDPWRVWWTQAEAVVGLVNEYRRGGDERHLARAEAVWRYIASHIKDGDAGEWFWRVDERGMPDRSKPKVEPWKEPYHQARACLELIERAACDPG